MQDVGDVFFIDLLTHVHSLFYSSRKRSSLTHVTRLHKHTHPKKHLLYTSASLFVITEEEGCNSFLSFFMVHSCCLRCSQIRLVFRWTTCLGSRHRALWHRKLHVWVSQHCATTQSRKTPPKPQQHKRKLQMSESSWSGSSCSTVDFERQFKVKVSGMGW